MSVGRNESWFARASRAVVTPMTVAVALALTSPLLVTSFAAADDAAVPRQKLTTDVGRNRALAVAVQGDALVAKVCNPVNKSGERCDPTGGTTIKPQARARSLLPSVTLEERGVSQGVHLIEASAKSGSSKWVTLIAAGDDDQPRVVWTGFSDGPERGTEYAADTDKGTSKISVTRRVSLCGATVVASKQVLDTRSLTLVDVAAVDPVAAARKNAQHVVATKLASPPKSLPLLRGLGASSGDVDLLVDGDFATSWVEHAPGVGTNQFASLGAPESVAASALDIVLAPPQNTPDAAGARAPKTMLVVLGDRSLLVDLPEDATAAGASFSVPFGQPVHTKCVGVVLVDAYGGKSKGGDKMDPAVFVSEVSLRTRFENLSADDLAMSFKGGGADGRERSDLLAASGSKGVAAAVRAYPSLDRQGQDLARRVIDASSCEQKLALYVPMLASREPDEVSRAHDHVRRCGKEAAPALLARLNASAGPARAVFAEELALLDPAAAIPALVEGLAKSTAVPDRRLFRKAIAKGAQRDSSVAAFETALGADRFEPLSPTVKLDLLRAMGSRLGETKSGVAAFSSVSKQATDFRDKYLLLGPAASLARSGDATAKSILGSALAADPDGRIRARAAEVAHAIPGLERQLFAASSDKAVRVREAAVHSLTDVKLPIAAQTKLATALASEPWTFVRRATAQALAGMPGEPTVDATLAFAMEHEEQPTVRRDILATLGARRASSQRDAISERALDTGEAVDVRIEAIASLGKICDIKSADELSKLATRGLSPMYEADRKLAVASIQALGKIHPPDLDKRLAALLANDSPGDMKDAARVALKEPRCR